MTYWTGLLLGAAGFLVLSVVLTKLPKDSDWRVPTIVVGCLSAAFAVVAAGRLFLP